MHPGQGSLLCRVLISCPHSAPECGEQGGGGMGSGSQNFVYPKWPDQIFPFANFLFSHDGHFVLVGGGGSRPLGF